MATIYQNRKDGKIISFKFKAFLGRDENGKQIFKCKTWKPEKVMSENKLILQAEKEATIWEHQLNEFLDNEKQRLSPTEITFESFVKNLWFPNKMNDKEHRVSTISFHNSLLRIIYNYLGEFKLKSITSRDIEGYLDYLRNVYKTPQNKLLSPKTIRHHYCTLNLIFEYATKLSYVTENPLKNIDSPKLVKHKVDALSKAEVLTFIKELDQLPIMHQTIYHLLLTTGIRRGECFGLQWADIDFENRLIHITRNVTYTALGGINVGLPKTNTSIREIPITSNVIRLLTEYKSKEEKEYIITENSFVFHSQNSPLQPHEPTYLTKHLKKFMKNIGLPDMSPHDLRHTCASILLQSGADIKSVQDILGHTDAATTLNFYVRSNIESMRTSTEKAFNL